MYLDLRNPHEVKSWQCRVSEGLVRLQFGTLRATQAWTYGSLAKRANRASVFRQRLRWRSVVLPAAVFVQAAWSMPFVRCGTQRYASQVRRPVPVGCLERRFHAEESLVVAYRFVCPLTAPKVRQIEETIECGCRLCKQAFVVESWCGKRPDRISS